MQRTNRREALRIEDEVLLNVYPIPEENMDNMEDFFKTRRSAFSLRSHLTYGAEQNIPRMRIIERAHPEIASYLKFLEQQIEYISAQISQYAFGRENLASTQKVSLSASGIQFDVDSNIKLNDLVVLELSLVDDNMHILAFAKIVRLNAISNSLHSVSANFFMLHEEDKEVIIKHVHRLHVKQLREKKKN